jgi:hypothetical protein
MSIIVTAGVRSSLHLFQGSWQCAAQSSHEHTLTYLTSNVFATAQSLTTRSLIVLRVTVGTCPFRCSHRKDCHSWPPTSIPPSCTLLCGHSELEYAKTTTSASQLEVHPQAALVDQFPDSDNITGHIACQVADRSPWQCPKLFQPKC